MPSINPLRFFVKAKEKLNFLIHLSAANVSELGLYNYFISKAKVREKTNNVIVVQCVEDIYYFGIFGKITSSLQSYKDFEVDQFVLNSLRVNDFKSFRNYLANRITHSILSRKWIFLYSAYCHKVGFYGASLSWTDVLDCVKAIKVWRNLGDTDQLNKLVINHILVGDLINDTYIRFKPSPTVKINTFYLLHVIWQAHRYLRNAHNYFSKVKPKIFLTSYSTYIQHGIAVRVALANQVNVFSFGNYQEFAKALSIADSVHTRNCEHYAAEFLKLGHPETRLAQAESKLIARFSGKIDSATAYMKKSAYAASAENLPDIKNYVAVYMHDFYDSPHVYLEMVFPDFWEWICFTIETLQEANIDFFLKPHPNQVSLSDAVITELRSRYPDVMIISPEISNKKIVDAGIKCAVTVYGTVAHEMAYLGIPSISSAKHPHSSFSFCLTAKTRHEYTQLLKKSADISIDKHSMRTEALSFYYMHNLHFTDADKALLQEMENFRSLCKLEQLNTDELTNKLNDIGALESFDQFIKMLAHN
jgi:hypothetical protein